FRLSIARTRIRLHPMANDSAPRPPEPAAHPVCTVLDFYSDLYLDRSHAQHAGSRRHGADSIVGESVARLRGFLSGACKSLEPRAARGTDFGGDLFSTDSAKAGGACLMLRPSRIVVALLLSAVAAPLHAQTGGELHFCLHNEPKTFNPVLVEDEAAENI